MIIDLGDIFSIAVGSLGIGGGIISLYIRSSIANTIINKLDTRYPNKELYEERHTNLTEQLTRVEFQNDKLNQKVDLGFDSIKAQIIATQVLRNRKREVRNVRIP